MTVKLRMAAAAAAAAMVFVTGAALAASYTVKAGGGEWNPSFKKIEKGDRIVWKNPTGKKHTVTAYRGDWNKNTTLKPGEQTSKRFRKRGVYKYRCVPHSAMVEGKCKGMCGTIKVVRPD